jgi:phosphonate transport system permease protein
VTTPAPPGRPTNAPPPARYAWIVPTVYAVLTVVALWWSLGALEVDWAKLSARGPQIQGLFNQMFGPPAWGQPREEMQSLLGQIGTRLKESFQIAALGTALAAVLALPFGALAARNLWPVPALPAVGKVLLNVVRTFPELMLAIAFIKAVGPGPFAGLLAVGIHSIGMMGKLYAERIESVDKGAIEALTATGASPLEVFRHAIVPEVLPDFLSFVLYRFDLNIRSASVLGLVGAGGIGVLLDLRIKGGAWNSIGIILLSIILTVTLVEFVSSRLRAKLA